MKIAIVTETFLPSTDGIVTRLTACIRWLLQKGHDVRVIAPDLGVYEFEGAEIKGVPARTLPFYRSKQFALPHPLVKRYIEEYQPDIVHVVNPALIGFSGVRAAKKLHYPLLASYHTNVAKYLDYYHLSPFKGLIWWYFRKLHNQADLNLCTSKTVEEELNEHDFFNVHVWHRGVDTAMFHPDNDDAAVRNRLTAGRPQQKLLLYVGRLAPEKEIEKLKHVLDESDEFSLAIVGDGPHREALKQHFAGTKTVFTGFMHGQDLAKAYASADVFVFPSTTETLGLVILEAMASGLPIVAAKSGPTCEQIEDGKTGLLYDAQIEGDFTKTIRRFEDEMLRKRLAVNAREDIQELGWAKASEQLLTLYEELAGIHGESKTSTQSKQQLT
ncbi:Glycosyltransferase involved in cell wall bisynthesis [Alteribacillus persepolensis]|uniref:Glycosyltransferase involved in cell wall bisynthesis n=1 Tax=Alteribacillus persepolensis TaxID=568899 RepID=A0A1G8FKW4_9BACI|nr:glycosyltransferase family 1 protein [Alteribacillus persepolensis]SDH82784.1 Glycosyltransferase involved in cell wall bisynthesis [Alteribacillus persepolensis]